MTLSDFRTRVCRAIGMSASDAGDLALIDSWVNESVVQFLRETKMNVLTASLAATAGVSDYTLDSDILSFADVWYSPADGTQETMLEPIDSRELRRRQQLESHVAGTAPRYYATQGAHLLLLHPTPESSSDMLHILYTPRPGLIASEEQSPEDESRGNIPAEYHSVLEAYVKWKAAEAEEHRPSEYGMRFQAEYERGVSMARASMNKKAGVFRGKKTAGRRAVWPTTPGTDVR